MSVDFPLDQEIESTVALAEELSEEYGVLLGVHNHGGRHWLGNRQSLDWLFGKTSNRVGLSLDTAWAIDSREDPVAMVRDYADRLHIIHVKDFLYSERREHRDVIVGTGILDLAKLDEALAEAGFSGEAILEYEGDVDNPLPPLRECVKAVGETMKTVQVGEA
jgi:sugar phosphate isomerase/epimerase